MYGGLNLDSLVTLAEEKYSKISAEKDSTNAISIRVPW